jgi:hypothetical protein
MASDRTVEDEWNSTVCRLSTLSLLFIAAGSLLGTLAVYGVAFGGVRTAIAVAGGTLAIGMGLLFASLAEVDDAQ